MTLGLHVDRFSASPGFFTREHARRIWCTLYVFDQEVSLRTGKPCSIVDGAATDPIKLPSEKVLIPSTLSVCALTECLQIPCSTSTQPDGYVEVSVALARLTKRTMTEIYHESGQAPSSALADILTSLKGWETSLPSWLILSEHTPPSHGRVLGILWARYMNAVILATRIFLLAAVLDQEKPRYSHSRSQLFNDLGKMCTDAATSILTTFEYMARRGILSSTVVADFNHLLDAAQVLLLASRSSLAASIPDLLDRVQKLFAALPEVGWTKYGLPEVNAQFQAFHSARASMSTAFVNQNADIPAFAQNPGMAPSV